VAVASGVLVARDASLFASLNAAPAWLINL